MSPIEVQITDAVSMLEESAVMIGSIRLARDFRYGTVPLEGQGTSSIAGQNFTSVRQPLIPMSDGSLGPATQLTTCIIMATGYLSPNRPRIGEKLIEAPAESRPRIRSRVR